jgi:hypothetical protein
MGDPLNDRLPPGRPDRGLIQSADDLSPEQVATHNAGQRLNIEIGRLRQRESMLEAQIEVLELTIARLRAVCDAAFTFVREDGGPDDWTAWQTLVCALEDANYKPVDYGHVE